MSRNIKLSFLAFLCISLCNIGNVFAQEAPNQLSRKEQRQGWKLLFDGKDLQGWHTYNKNSTDPVWTVDDGAIKLDHSQGQGGGDLVTNDEYSNYDLKIQWKISEAGNSGIIFNVHEDPSLGASYFSGPEMQVLDNVKADDNKKDNHLAGSLYDLIAADPKTVHPAGEWNAVEIKMDHKKLTLWMNGTEVVHTTIGTPEWKNLIAHSKFRGWKDFAAYDKGRIALQDHGHSVWYRDIKIRAL